MRPTQTAIRTELLHNLHLTVNDTGCGPEPNSASSRCSRSATHRPPPVKPCFVSGTRPEPASCSLPVPSDGPSRPTMLTATLRIRRTVTRRTRQSYIGDYASSSARAWIAPFTGSDICVDRTQCSYHRSSDVVPARLSRCSQGDSGRVSHSHGSRQLELEGSSTIPRWH